MTLPQGQQAHQNDLLEKLLVMDEELSFYGDDTKEEIDSLGEFDNGNKYFIIYKIKNSKILKFAEVEIQYN